MMWLPRAALVLLLWTLLSTLISQVSCSGVFNLRLKSFRNDRGLNADGHCCNGRKINNSCTSTCRTFFQICLTHFQAKIAESTTTCTFAHSSTPVLGGNSIDFSQSNDIADFHNPIEFPFKFSWPGTFSLIIEAWHDSTLQEPSPGSPRELISRLAVQRSAVVGEQWSKFNSTLALTELEYEYKVSCDDTYYGPGCSVLCRPRDDNFGHYNCSPDGSKVCMDGWKGNYCEQAICLPGCHPDHGLCNKPNECNCRLGWRGKMCDQCMPYPNCKNGTCSKPWECNCEEGWGGLFCNQDLNYCTHHKPCKNGGTCQNTGQGSFTCDCLAGFSGKHCEVEIDDCAARPCLNGGTCEDVGDGFRCTCPMGYHGPLCQVRGTTCLDNKCSNGGTCVIENGNHKCLCSKAYTGPNCEREINECQSNPCQNGGRCLDELGGFRCICDSGFQGATCEENMDDCTNNPCLNGATCLDQVNSYACQCVPGFVGRHCGTNVDDCDMHPCANGGTCSDLVNDFECTCAVGFSGKDCRNNINECASSPCENGATCQDLVADYLCACNMGFWGKNCQYLEGQTPEPEEAAVQLVTDKTVDYPADSSNLTQSLVGSDTEGLSMQQWALVVCFGAGIPLIIIIIVVLILLLRRRRQSLQQDNMHKEREQNDVNNMNNKCLETNIFTTIPPSSTSTVKVRNEDQDFNTFKQTHNYLEKSSNHKQLIKDLNTNEQFPRKDLEPTQCLKIPEVDRVSTADHSSHLYNSEYQQEKAFVKTVNTPADKPGSVLRLDQPLGIAQYRDGVLATEV